MSTDALEVMNAQMVEAVENGPSSQEFTLDPDGSAITFKGIFDNATENDNQDSGHVRQQSRTPRILVSEILDGFVREAEVTDGTTTWHISKPDKDENGIPVIWLY